MAQTRGTAAFLSDNTEYRDVYVLLEGSLKELKPIWRQYTNIETSDRKTEISQSYIELGDVPEKAEGANYATDLIRPGFQKSVSHTEFGLGFEMTETAGEDDRFGVLKRNTKWLAFSARYVEEKRAAATLNNGFSTETTADGVAAFSASHVLGNGDAMRNILNPGQDLSWNSLTQAMIDVQTETKSDGGRLVTPITSWDLIVPPALEFTAARIINSTLLPGVADNDANVLKQRRTFNIIVNPHLTDADAWFLLAGDKGRHGLMSYTRVPITMVKPMEDARTGNTIYKVRFRRSWFWRDPQGAFASQGA
jgi:phage major head subunit gpT-like protein